MFQHHKAQAVAAVPEKGEGEMVTHDVVGVYQWSLVFTGGLRRGAA